MARAQVAVAGASCARTWHDLGRRLHAFTAEMEAERETISHAARLQNYCLAADADTSNGAQ